MIPVAAALSLGVLMGGGRDPSERPLAPSTFMWYCGYVVLLGVVTLAPPPMSLSNGLWGLNLVPLVNSVRCFVPNPGQPSTTAFCIRTILGNVVIFVPFGMLLPLMWHRMSSVQRVALSALVVSSSIEILQYAGRRFGNPRWSDVDDVIFNVLGAMLGYAMLRLAIKQKSKDQGVASR